MDKSKFLNKLERQYSISNSDFEKLQSSYNDISNWLVNGEDIDDISILPQGSLALGTIIKPIDRDEDDFDVDLLARVNDKSLKTDLNKLKSIVGDRLKENKRYANLKEGKRCWTIEYNDRHIDILPCIPDENGYLITTEKTNYGTYISHSTNPIGYQKWFLKKTKKTVRITDSEIKNLNFIKSTSNLQKIVKLCKLHRNHYYDINNKNVENRPISIIISTLIARSYTDCESSDLYDQFIYTISHMNDYIEKNGSIYFIKNPVDAKENFADKWQTHPERETEFFEWMNLIQEQCKSLEYADDMIKQAKIFKQMFGNTASNAIYESFGDEMRTARESGKLYIDDQLRLNSDCLGNKVKNHTFYGKEDKDKKE